MERFNLLSNYGSNRLQLIITSILRSVHKKIQFSPNVDVQDLVGVKKFKKISHFTTSEFYLTCHKQLSTY